MKNAITSFISYLSISLIVIGLSSAGGCKQDSVTFVPHDAQENSLLPAYNQLEQNYKRYGVNTPNHMEINDYELGDILGGYVEYNIDAEIFQNTCAIRVSDMLNRCGDLVPYITDQTSSCENGNKHIFRVAQLDPYLTERYGQPNIVGSNITQFLGKPGIILFHVPNTWESSTGHVALWDGFKCLGGKTNDVFLFNNASEIKLWLAD